MWRALRGAVEGAVVVGLGFLLGAVLSGQALVAAVPQALIGAIFGALMFATGRAVAGRVAGAALLGTGGLILGALCGERFLGLFPYQRPAQAQPGHEIEIAGPTVQGPPFDLKALRGKVVLVDFWATWCGPCVAELPHVKEVYDRYHDKGFEVVGVSLDTSREKLEAFIKERQVPWPQIFFDEEGKRGWANPLARRYEVNSIPNMFLIDPDGRLVTDDPESVRGGALGPAVARLLDEQGQRTAGEAAQRTRTVYFPLGLLVGALLGCVAGSVGGAMAERALRRPKQGGTAPAPPPRDKPA
jgi:thiol-disulfide isomerase/thioredoxin